jgi:DNA-binding NtrC family response regulator
MSRILIVDDEPNMHKILASNLEQDKHVVSHAAGVEEAREAIASRQFDAILADDKMVDGSCLDVLASATGTDPTISVVLFTTEATLDLAEEGMRKGAFIFLAKHSAPGVLCAAIQRACDHTTLLRETRLLKATVEHLETTPSSGNGHAWSKMGWMEALPPSFDLRNLLSTVEKTLIERTLQSTQGAQAEAARRLGLSRSDLSYKLLKYELRKISTPS